MQIELSSYDIKIYQRWVQDVCSILQLIKKNNSIHLLLLFTLAKMLLP